ncbi:tRNA (adenosine(37)-N6)-threonylcarbamoyltransferase complex dimerization subunit type 1 TsaB [Candidatus Saccharibacteria bacterium]|nr:tRNA (adenosine(37)-N6)-threonylcarbamoyltransferase complex dimerization subunit type 1 TsaB [Candidatus Saccharibacteria bacterium]
MNLYLDTSDFKAILKLDEKSYEADLGREMAEKLLGFIEEKLKENGATWSSLSKITFFSGPGSFTGLRIGASVVNTLAHDLNIPLFDHHGTQHKIILPDYGRPANISAPRK